MPADAAIATHATERDAGLRRDIRELGALLGRTLVRQEGEQLLELVERTRGLIRSDRAAAASLLAEVEPAAAIRLVREFRTYCNLANVAEMEHRGRELAELRRLPRPDAHGALERLGVRGGAGSSDADLRVGGRRRGALDERHLGGRQHEQRT